MLQDQIYILLFSRISNSRIFLLASLQIIFMKIASWDQNIFHVVPSLSAITISHDTSHTRVYVYKSFIKYILWLGKTNCSVSYNLITVSCHVSVISTIHHVQKKIFFFLASFTEENFVLTYWWWHFILSDVNFGGAILSNWPFVNSNQTKCLSLTKLHFQIYLLWRYGMMMIMRWKKFLGIKKKTKLPFATMNIFCSLHQNLNLKLPTSNTSIVVIDEVDLLLKLIEVFCLKRVTR